MSRRLVLRGLHFLWRGPTGTVHGKILGRLHDIDECNAFLVELFGTEEPLRTVITLDTIADGLYFQVFETEAACRKMFREIDETINDMYPQRVEPDNRNVN